MPPLRPLLGEEGDEYQRAQERAEDGTEQDERYAPSSAFGRVHVSRRDAREHYRPDRSAKQGNPKTTATTETNEAPRPVRTQPSIPKPNPPASTGTRPRRSIALPAGKAERAAVPKKMAGPNPTSPSRPLTAAKVIGPTAAASSTIP